MSKIVLLAFVLSFLVSCNSSQVFYVDSTFKGEYSDGSIKHPFRDFESAYSQIQQLKEKRRDIPVELIFREGTYIFKNGYYLNELFSHLTISAAAGEHVIFSGGKSLPINTILEKDGKTHKLDLTGIADIDYGSYYNIGFNRPSRNSSTELFVNGKPMVIARWPNNGMVPIGKIIETGSIPRFGDFSNKSAIFRYDSVRISSWEYHDDMWISGYFHHGYADDALRIAHINRIKKEIVTDGPTLYGFASGQPWQRFYAFNIREELDTAGEFYLDKKEKALYFIPRENTLSDLWISQLNEVMFDIHKAADISFNNIVFEYSKAPFFSLVESESIKIRSCIFRNSGSLAIIIGNGIEPMKEYVHEGTGNPIRGMVGSLNQHLYENNAFNRLGGKNNLVEACRFYNLGAGAVSLGGGNRFTLEKGNNEVKDCVFYNNNRIDKSYKPHIDITGVGNKISGCELYDSPSMAILAHGNNHLIENNYIHDVCLEVEDQGAFYYGRNPSECGITLRNNLFANIPSVYSTCAIYNDDGAGGLIVENNIFYNAGRYGVLLGGGSYNQYRNNLFINMPFGIHIDNRLQNWSKALLEEDGLFEKRLKEVNYNKEPYLSEYPYLRAYFPNDGAPAQNMVENNIFVGVEKLSDQPEYLELNDNIEKSEKVHLDSFSVSLLKEYLSTDTLYMPFQISLSRINF